MPYLLRFDFGLRNVLRATTPCTFSRPQLPNMLSPLYFAHFDFEMCFASQPCVIVYLLPGQMARSSGATKQWENRVFRDFLPFRASASSFFWLFLWSSFYWLFLFSDSSHLCFSICPHCRKFDFYFFFDNIHSIQYVYIYIYLYPTSHVTWFHHDVVGDQGLTTTLGLCAKLHICGLFKVMSQWSQTVSNASKHTLATYILSSALHLLIEWPSSPS